MAEKVTKSTGKKRKYVKHSVKTSRLPREIFWQKFPLRPTEDYDFYRMWINEGNEAFAAYAILGGILLERPTHEASLQLVCLNLPPQVSEQTVRTLVCNYPKLFTISEEDGDTFRLAPGRLNYVAPADDEVKNEESSPEIEISTPAPVDEDVRACRPVAMGEFLPHYVDQHFQVVDDPIVDLTDTDEVELSEEVQLVQTEVENFNHLLAHEQQAWDHIQNFDGDCVGPLGLDGEKVVKMMHFNDKLIESLKTKHFSGLEVLSESLKKIALSNSRMFDLLHDAKRSKSAKQRREARQQAQKEAAEPVDEATWMTWLKEFFAIEQNVDRLCRMFGSDRIRKYSSQFMEWITEHIRCRHVQFTKRRNFEYYIENLCNPGKMNKNKLYLHPQINDMFQKLDAEEAKRLNPDGITGFFYGAPMNKQGLFYDTKTHEWVNYGEALDRDLMSDEYPEWMSIAQSLEWKGKPLNYRFPEHLMRKLVG